MWVFLNNAMLSIVAHKEKHGVLHVRARVKGDIEKVFPNVEVLETPNGDYQFRADVPRNVLCHALINKVHDIDYTNFKNSVKDRERHDVYFKVWQAMYDWQYRIRSRRKRSAFVSPMD